LKGNPRKNRALSKANRHQGGKVWENGGVEFTVPEKEKTLEQLTTSSMKRDNGRERGERGKNAPRRKRKVQKSGKRREEEIGVNEKLNVSG